MNKILVSAIAAGLSVTVSGPTFVAAGPMETARTENTEVRIRLNNRDFEWPGSGKRAIFLADNEISIPVFIEGLDVGSAGKGGTDCVIKVALIPAKFDPPDWSVVRTPEAQAKFKDRLTVDRIHPGQELPRDILIEQKMLQEVYEAAPQGRKKVMVALQIHYSQEGKRFYSTNGTVIELVKSAEIKEITSKKPKVEDWHDDAHSKFWIPVMSFRFDKTDKKPLKIGATVKIGTSKQVDEEFTATGSLENKEAHGGSEDLKVTASFGYKDIVNAGLEAGGSRNWSSEQVRGLSEALRRSTSEQTTAEWTLAIDKEIAPLSGKKVELYLYPVVSKQVGTVTKYLEPDKYGHVVASKEEEDVPLTHVRKWSWTVRPTNE
jgi:hypothetical protein